MNTPITCEFADVFARDWFEAWNTHDLERILKHYDDAVRFTSPFAIEFADETGTVNGKQALRAYWEKALERLPDLEFQPINTVPGVDSISLIYVSVRNLYAVETMLLGEDGLVREVHCHYRPRDQRIGNFGSAPETKEYSYSAAT
jgi:hypothetical protein